VPDLKQLGLYRSSRMNGSSSEDCCMGPLERTALADASGMGRFLRRQHFSFDCHDRGLFSFGPTSAACCAASCSIAGSLLQSGLEIRRLEADLSEQSQRIGMLCLADSTSNLPVLLPPDRAALRYMPCKACAWHGDTLAVACVRSQRCAAWRHGGPTASNVNFLCPG
jgi:hypothetical protein